MTKKHFELFASTIKAQYLLDRPWAKVPEETRSAALVTINIVIEVAVASNDRFDARRFRAACGAPA